MREQASNQAGDKQQLKENRAGYNKENSKGAKDGNFHHEASVFSVEPWPEFDGKQNLLSHMLRKSPTPPPIADPLSVN